MTAKIISSRILRRSLVASSLAWYYAFMLYPILTTHLCQNCGASLLWKCTILASLPSWLIFVCNWLASKNRPSAPLYGLISLIFVLVGVIPFSVALAPQIIYAAFAQAYDIVYVEPLQFAFPSGMILALIVTSGVVAFNFGIAFRREVEMTATPLRQVRFALGLAARNIAVYIAVALVSKQMLGTANQFLAFVLLMTLNMIIPILHPVLACLPRKAVKALEIVGISTTLSIYGVVEFFEGFPLTTPFLVFALAASLLVCISSALGEVGAVSVDLRSMGHRLTRRRFFALAVLLILSVLFTLATWVYSHAHIAVTLHENITVSATIIPLALLT
jgi:hypothetical protein